jgi:hypothetical protein
LFFQLHQQIHSRPSFRSTIQDVTDLHESRISSNPFPVPVDDAGALQNGNEGIVSSMYVGDGNNPWLLSGSLGMAAQAVKKKGANQKGEPDEASAEKIDTREVVPIQ